jgi:sialic acid synthase SpsE
MKCEIIVEIGQNHNGDMKVAKELIHAAKENGGDVAKFQLFDAKALFPTKEQGNEWFDYNCKTELSKDNIQELKAECDKVGIEFMSSAFDPERVGWLEKIGVRRHKVASRSIKDKAMLDAVTATGKPIIASLGLWTEAGFPKISTKGGVSYLYCVCKYPTPLVDLHFEDVEFGKDYAGFSDHTIGLSAPVAAIARGARIIEKHFTLDKKMHGPDHEGSMTPAELKELSRFRDEIAVCLGDMDAANDSAVMTGTGKAFVLKA